MPLFSFFLPASNNAPQNFLREHERTSLDEAYEMSLVGPNHKRENFTIAHLLHLPSSKISLGDWLATKTVLFPSPPHPTHPTPPSPQILEESQRVASERRRQLAEVYTGLVDLRVRLPSGRAPLILPVRADAPAHQVLASLLLQFPAARTNTSGCFPRASVSS